MRTRKTGTGDVMRPDAAGGGPSPGKVARTATLAAGGGASPQALAGPFEAPGAADLGAAAGYQAEDPFGMHLIGHEIAPTLSAKPGTVVQRSPSDGGMTSAKAPAAATGGAPPTVDLEKSAFDGPNHAASIDWNKHAPENFELVAKLPAALQAIKKVDPTRRFTFREIFDAYLDQELAVVLTDWSAPTAAAVRASIKSAPGSSKSEDLRKRLWQASQYAVIKTLDVEGNVKKDGRYEPGAVTHCNVYAYDLVSALGGYLPRVWWRDPDAVKAKIAAGTMGEPALGGLPHHVMELSANLLANWFDAWGEKFGWAREASPAQAQRAANDGSIVIAVAFNATKKPVAAGAKSPPDLFNSGHITVVVAEQSVAGDPNAGQKAPGHGGPNGEVTIPLQSQAGTTNIALGGVAHAWWDGPEMRQELDEKGTDKGNFWICRPGKAKHAMATPEQLGALGSA